MRQQLVERSPKRAIRRARPDWWRCCEMRDGMPRTPTRTEALYGDLVSQYLALQEEHPGVVLLFGVGSFYEVLFEDAEVVARELGLKLSDRPSGGSAPTVPQCGFAHHALDSFLARLLAKGYRVAVVEE